jgi:hypothetical protein
MGLKNLRDKVKQHQEKVGEKVFASTIMSIYPHHTILTRKVVLC